MMIAFFIKAPMMTMIIRKMRPRQAMSSSRLAPISRYRLAHRDRHGNGSYYLSDLVIIRVVAAGKPLPDKQRRGVVVAMAFQA